MEFLAVVGDALIHAELVSKSYHGRTILQAVTLSLAPAEVVTLIGPNGAGKSSLLKILVGLEQPDNGTVTRKQGLRVGYVPQSFKMSEALPMTVERFLLYYKDKSEPATRIQEVAGLLGVAQLLSASVHGLSGGELRRVLLARAILNHPDLLILDEPLAGVDVNGQSEIYELIERLVHQYGCGVLMVSHDLHLVMASSHQVICLNQHVCCQGQPHQLGDDPEFVKLFGPKVAAQLALYSHAHDHEHNMHGDVVHQECDHDHS